MNRRAQKSQKNRKKSKNLKNLKKNKKKRKKKEKKSQKIKKKYLFQKIPILPLTNLFPFEVLLINLCLQNLLKQSKIIITPFLEPKFETSPIFRISFISSRINKKSQSEPGHSGVEIGIRNHEFIMEKAFFEMEAFGSVSAFIF
jgi:hypothetical protein